MVKRRGTDEVVYQAICGVLIVSLVIACILPILYVVSMSLTSKDEVIRNSGRYVLFPGEYTFAAYQWLFNGGWIPNAMFISLARTVTGTAATLAVTSMGAFVLSRSELPGRRFFILVILVTILFPGGLIPNYLLIDSLKLKNNFLVFILPMLVDCWGLLVIKQFMEQLPDSLPEAAEIDGAGQFSIFTRVFIPLSKPVLAAIGLFTAVAHWNSWFDSLLYVSNDKLWPFQYVLRNILQGYLNIQASTGQAAQSAYVISLQNRTNSQSMQMAAVIIGTAPIIVVYPFLQKHFAKGMLTGSVKG